MASSQEPLQTSPPCESPSLPLENHLCRRAERESKLYETSLKMKLASTGRLMQDNQRLLDTTAKDTQLLRDQRRRAREAQMEKQFPTVAQPVPDAPPSDPMGDINIDSPSNVHHHYPQIKSGLSKLAVAAITAGSILGGIGAMKLLSPLVTGDGRTGGSFPPVISKKHDAVQYQQQPSGEWKEVGREPLDYTKPK